MLKTEGDNLVQNCTLSSFLDFRPSYTYTKMNKLLGGSLRSATTTTSWNRQFVMAFKPRPLILCGPSGSGKSTLLNLLMKEFGDCFGFSVSHTARKPRNGEIDGKDYHFVDRKTLEEAISRGEFLESATYSGNLYGTSKAAVKAVQNANKICILDIDVQGVKSIKKTDLNPKYVFIKPPSLEEMEKRLRDRGTETEESLKKRLATAKEEINYANKPDSFDIIIVNDEVERAYQQLKNFVMNDIQTIRETKSENIKRL